MLKMRSIGQMVQKLSFGQSVYTDRQTGASETFPFPLLGEVIMEKSLI